MGIPQKSLVIGACEIACHYPELRKTKRKRLSLSQLAVLSVLIKISRLKKR